MIHASVELISAMNGWAPRLGAIRWHISEVALQLACSDFRNHDVERVAALRGVRGDWREDKRVVSCPECLVLMDMALSGVPFKGAKTHPYLQVVWTFPQLYAREDRMLTLQDVVEAFG